MSDTQEKDPILMKISAWKQESENLRSSYDTRWTKNQQLFKGKFSDDEVAMSKVRNRSKIFFRKIWATNWRMVASFYNAFLKDPDTFKIEGRGPEDVHKARVLQKVVEYRRDRMMRRDDLFLKFIWAFFDIVNNGWSVGKLRWDYDEDAGKDEPRFMLYPNEQVYPDLTAETKQGMRYITFVSYLTKDDLEDMNYDNIEDAEPTGVPSNPLRQVRHEQAGDPMQNPGNTEYPTPGKYEEGRGDGTNNQRYEVWETFYRVKGEVKYCVTNAGKEYFKKPEKSKYGNHYENIIMGSCLTEAHKLIGEGFNEALEGPQESINATLNMRKDNVALTLAPHTLVNIGAKVDLQSLVQRRPGGITLTSDMNAVKVHEMPDVTHTAYLEASADEQMMSEMSGITPGKQGLETASKATVAQINYSEANIKIDLFISIVGETFVKEFFAGLAQMVQQFETDETVLRIANDTVRAEEEAPYLDDVYDFDFEADCIMSIGVGTVGRDVEIRQTMLAMDRAIMSNQSIIQLLSTGAVVDKGLKLFDTTRFMEKILPKLGHKNIQEYIIDVKPPPQQQQEGGGAPGMAGQTPAAGELLNMQNDLQAGGLGGL